MYVFRDILLLEAGFLAMIVAPLQILGLPSKHHHDNVTMWLVKWLLFRLMFASGVVKLQSHCDTWWSLTGVVILRYNNTSGRFATQ